MKNSQSLTSQVPAVMLLPSFPGVNIVDCVASDLKFSNSEVKLVGKRASELIKAHNHDPRSLLDVLLFVQAPNLLLLKSFIREAYQNETKGALSMTLVYRVSLCDD